MLKRKLYKAIIKMYFLIKYKEETRHEKTNMGRPADSVPAAAAILAGGTVMAGGVYAEDILS